MIALGRYRHNFLDNVFADVTDGDDEAVVYTEVSPKGTKEGFLDIELFSQLYFKEKDWKPNPHADFLKAVAQRIEEEPDCLSRLQALLENAKKTNQHKESDK